MNRSLAILVLLAACGGKSAPATSTVTSENTTESETVAEGGGSWWCYTDSNLDDCQQDRATCDAIAAEQAVDACREVSEVWCMTWREEGIDEPQALCAETEAGCADLWSRASEMSAELVGECAKAP